MNRLANAVGAVCDRCGDVFRCRSTPPSCLCNPCWLGQRSQHISPQQPITRTATKGRL